MIEHITKFFKPSALDILNAQPQRDPAPASWCWSGWRTADGREIDTAELASIKTESEFLSEMIYSEINMTAYVVDFHIDRKSPIAGADTHVAFSSEKPSHNTRATFTRTRERGLVCSTSAAGYVVQAHIATPPAGIPEGRDHREVLPSLLETARDTRMPIRLHATAWPVFLHDEQLREVAQFDGFNGGNQCPLIELHTLNFVTNS